MSTSRLSVGPWLDPGRLGLWAANTLILLFLLAPIVIVVIMSFSNSASLAFPPHGFSTRWYKAFADNPDFVDSLVLSLKLAVIAASITTALGLLTAMALEIGRVRGATALRTLFLTPLAVPSVVVGIGMLFYYTRLNLAGGVFVLILAHTVVVLPFTVIILSSSLRNFDVSTIEAARNLGASWPRVTGTVIIPLIKGALVAAFVFAFMTSMDEVVVTLLLASPLTTTLPVRIFNYVQYTQDPTPAAISTVLIAGTVCAVVILNRFVRFTRVF